MPTTSVIALLKKYGITPKKRLGQHFLSATPTIKKIVDAIAPSKGECILEIGPGPGIMTSLLAEKAGHVIAIDRDAELLEIARSEFGSIPNITWLESDILKVDLEEILSARGSWIPPLNRRRAGVDRGSKIVGNLPYNISSPILFWLIENRSLISRAVIMVQKEVAQRIAAKPGGKDYGVLSVQTQAYARVKKLFDVSPKNFIPPPKVMSSVLEIDFTANDIDEPEDYFAFKEVVRAAFGKRRKTIRNALLGSSLARISAATIDPALEEAGIDPKRRPETLTVDEFKRLASLLKN